MNFDNADTGNIINCFLNLLIKDQYFDPLKSKSKSKDLFPGFGGEVPDFGLLNQTAIIDDETIFIECTMLDDVASDIMDRKYPLLVDDIDYNETFSNLHTELLNAYDFFYEEIYNKKENIETLEFLYNVYQQYGSLNLFKYHYYSETNLLTGILAQ